MKSFLKTMFATIVGTVVGSLILFFIFSAIVGAVIFENQEPTNKVSDSTVLHLDLHGRLVEKASPIRFDLPFAKPFWSNYQDIGIYDVNEALESAQEDPRVKGLYIKIGSLEGGWAGMTSLRRSISEFKKSGKFVAVYADSYDEQTLYLASIADTLAIQPNGSVEFNGLSSTPMFLKGLLDKLEVTPRIFRVGKFKSAIEPLILDKMSDENRFQYQALLDSIWSHTKKEIGASLKLEPGDLDQIASGLEVDSSKTAQEKGLVGHLMYEHQLMQKLEADLKIKDPDQLNLVTLHEYMKSNTTKKKNLTAKNKVAVLIADGEITSGESGEENIGSESFKETLREIEEDDTIKAVVLRVNSPGGDALASDTMWAELNSLDEKIPLVSSFSNVAASGGYYIGVAARYIFSEADTLTGSIGVFGILMDTEKFFKNKAGVNFDRVVTNAHSDLGNANRPMEEIESKFIQGGVNQIYTRFLAVVNDGRKDKLKQPLPEIAEGRVWSGEQAQELGLVDEIGGLPAAIQKAAALAEIGDDYGIEIWPKNDDPFAQFAEQLMGASAKTALGDDVIKFAKQIGRLQKMKSGVYALDPVQISIH